MQNFPFESSCTTDLEIKHFFINLFEIKVPMRLYIRQPDILSSVERSLHSREFDSSFQPPLHNKQREHDCQQNNHVRNDGTRREGNAVVGECVMCRAEILA